MPENALLLSADFTSLYPSIPHEDDLPALYAKLEDRKDKKVPSENFTKMAEFVLKNNYFEFDGDITVKIPVRLWELNSLHNMHVFSRIWLRLIF